MSSIVHLLHQSITSSNQKVAMREIQTEDGRDGLLVVDNDHSNRMKASPDHPPMPRMTTMAIVLTVACILISVPIAVVRPKVKPRAGLSGELQENVQFFYAEWYRPDTRASILFANVDKITDSGPYCSKKKTSCFFNGTVWAEDEQNSNTTFTLKLSGFTLELILQQIGYYGWITGSHNTNGSLFLINEEVMSVDGVVLPHLLDSYSALESLVGFAEDTAEVYGFLQEASGSEE